MNIIVAVDKNWAIGCKNQLLYSIPEDMAFFKKTTLNKVVVMGANTFLSLPFGALKDRVNIVLSHDKSFKAEGAVVCYSLDELFKELKKYPVEDIFIIGGEMFYRTMLPFCSTAYITKVDAKTKDADCFFLNLDNLPQWIKIYTSPQVETNGYNITFNTYTQGR